ncbi:MAG TPA: trigger factor [Candidatus Hydrogenedens sp.]|nr:trigger factor [Candidatus Hydrogenedens sp.]
MMEQKNNNENNITPSESEQKDELQNATETTSEQTTTEELHEHKHHHHAHDTAEEEFKFEKDPEYEIDYKGDCLYSVKISIPAVNTKSQINKNLEEVKEHAELPGFRKGKAPMWLVENKFGKIARKEALDKVITESVKKLMEDNKLRAFSTPQFEGLEELDKLPEDKDISFQVSFEVAPRCELGKYRGLELERKVLEPDENMIAERLELLRNRFAIYQSIPDAEIANGDQAIIDFNGTIDGESFPGGTANNYPYIVGSKRFFGKFEEALIGAKVGETKTCEVEFPIDYTNKSLAGKKAIFEIKIKDIKRKEMPALDDEFAKQAGAKNLEDLKQKIKKELEDAISEETDYQLETDAIEQVIANSTFEIPKSLIEEVAKNQVEEQIQRMIQMRIPVSEIEKQREELEKDAKEKAEKTIKWYTVANEIAEAEGIEITDSDYEDEAQNIQGRTGIDIETIRNYIQEQGKEDVNDTIIRKKVVKLILDSAKIETKTISREEWEKKSD